MADLRWLRLPAEMRARRQWAVSSLVPDPETGKKNKIPINPITRQEASSTDPRSWVTFEDAINSGYPAIGYMLSAEDPLVIIDLDDKGDLTPEQRIRQLKIYETFQSYSERSQSGLGVHIILRGKIGGGMNRDKVEIYDQERYIICTGDVVRDLDVNECEFLPTLVKEMGGVVNGTHYTGPSVPPRYSDEELISKATNARNGEKFKDLYYRIPRVDEDWSQRDAALAQIIAFYTRNHDQALRIFRGSVLYRPQDKGKNPEHYENYYLLERTFGRAWQAEAVRDADLELGREMAERVLSQPAKSITATPVPDFPPGLVGEIAEYIYKASPRPVKEISLAGALAFCAGLLGRQFNIGGTGLNLYVVLIAETGRGKEAAPSGIEALVGAIRPQLQSIENFMGPAYFASGQALVRALDKNPAQYSAIGEFGHLLSRITSRRASPSDGALRMMLLALFSKSGKGQTLRPTAYSDTDKNTKHIEAPAFSFLGDTTPEVYYAQVNTELVGEGLLPRFLTITYDGPRPAFSETVWTTPKRELIDHLGAVVTNVLQMQHNSTFVDVPFSPEARLLDRQFDEHCDARINDASSGAMDEMWNRAHLKMRRIAALVAVGRNHLAPMVVESDIQWAEQLIRADIDRLAHRLNSGDVGTGDTRRLPVVEKAVNDYLVMDPDKKHKTYRVPKGLLDDKNILPYTYFYRRLKMHSSFTNDGRGLTLAIKSALQDAVDLGLLQRLAPDQKLLKGGRPDEGDWFTLGPDWK